MDGKQVSLEYGGKDCEIYMISIIPKEPKNPVKSATIHIHFPSEVASFIYFTDRGQSANAPPPNINGKFSFTGDGSCAVDAPTRGEPPPNVDVRRTGQLRRDLDMRIEDLTAESAFAIMVGANSSTNASLTVSGTATYASWNQDFPAPILVSQTKVQMTGKRSVSK